MHRLPVLLRTTVVCLAVAAAVPAWQAQAQAADRSESSAATTDRIYATARPRLLQIRTLLASTERQASLGSAFLVSGKGYAVTNYHVVSQFALEPQTYRLEYVAPDGQRGAVKLIAFDVTNDVALILIDRPGLPFFEFDKRALEDRIPNGERLYSMGNPLDIGFTIVEGTYNGRAARSYNERLHFSGALNPGMSGGPAVASSGRVVGVNVSKRLGGELVSFLVPARFAAELLARNPDPIALSPDAVRAEIGRQLLAWQAGLYKVLEEQALPSRTLGPYRAPDNPASWFNCWSRTNAEQVPKPRADLFTITCNTETSLFVAGDLSTGEIRVMHSYAKSVDLNSFQFAAFISSQYLPAWGGWNRKRHSRTRCHEAFTDGDSDGPSMRAVWCARAYRDFKDLYDVSLLTVTQDRGGEALVSRLSMQGVSYENAMQFGQRFQREIKVVR